MSAREPSPGRGLARRAGALILFVVITAAFFLLVEGAASTAFFARALFKQQEGVVITEEQHTRYDPDLGWVSLPNLSIPDMYGPGKGLTTNARGFRGSRDLSRRVEEGKRRVICSGDSFTLGHGVADQDTWCARLAALDPSLETVNMGQGGYGIDQAFLWHKKDGAELDRSVHILAFIGDDFLRTGRDHFLGYGKPVLRVVDGSLEVTNTPAPQRSRLRRWLIQNGFLFGELATVRLLSGLVSRGGTGDAARVDENRTWTVAAAIFDTLLAENASRGSRLVLVFLAAPWDYDTAMYEGWRARLREYADEKGVPLIDFVSALRELAADDAKKLFIPYGQVGAPHLNEAGNDWVARRILASGVLSPAPASPAVERP
jgi:hypothetical protein